MRIELLDHGYVELIETWGSDQRIIEAARMSTQKGFLGWGPKHVGDCPTIAPPHSAKCECEPKPGDEKLLKYLWQNKHATPFEFGGLVIEVKASIFVFREWHRHRTQCLAPDTLVHFESPKSDKHGRRVYKMRIEDVWKKWHPLGRRQRIQAMHLRCIDEGAREVVHTRIVDVIKGDPKPMIRVTTVSGRKLTATRSHRVLTYAGWMTLGLALDQDHLLCLVPRAKQRLVPVFEEIMSVEEAGDLPTYDLSVEGPWHNFVADGFVVHNSYNEMSARYTPLPDENYIPTVERLMLDGGRVTKQAASASGAAKLTESAAEDFRLALRNEYARQESLYRDALGWGVPKELARAVLPVGRYSKMRATANLRNWLAFLTLRMAPTAQWEIRQYADAVGSLIEKAFPRTWELFLAD